MKHLKTISESLNSLNEGKAEKDELITALDKVASDFWKKRGAKYGKKQKMKDIKIPSEAASTPSRFNEDSEFITSEAKIGVGGYSGRSITCELWIIPFKKDGSKGQEIKLSWVSL